MLKIGTSCRNVSKFAFDNLWERRGTERIERAKSKVWGGVLVVWCRTKEKKVEEKLERVSSGGDVVEYEVRR